MVVTQQNSKRFVEKLDFLTTPGYLTGPGAREAAGLPRDSGPYRVITDLAVMGYADDSRRMEVRSLHPGVTAEQVQAGTGFRLEFADSLATTEPPSELELRILCEEVDPHRYILGRPC
jgi:glutaconate CoA-transferase subunit B